MTGMEMFWRRTIMAQNSIKTNKARDWLVSEFLSALQQDKIPWEKPWSAEKPYNASTNNRYHGVNKMILEYIQESGRYTDPRWVTFNQAKELGWKMKGEKGTQKGTPLEIWSIYDRVKKKNVSQKEYEEAVQGEGRDPKEFYPFHRNFYVFNAEQFENVPELEKVSREPVDAIEMVERMSQNMGIQFIEGGTRAFYSPANDSITLPPKDTFLDSYYYSATKLHEMSHATGHPSRLNRNLSGRFGTTEYAKEELRAEISSSFLMGELGLDYSQNHLDNHKAYIQSWIKILENEPNELFNAIKDANQIADYLKDLSEREIVHKRDETFLDKRELYKQYLQEQLADPEQPELTFKGDLSKAIYMLDDIVVDGDFVDGIRGVEHHSLYDKDYATNTNFFVVNGQRIEFELEELSQWGTIIVPEENSYISVNDVPELNAIGFTKMQVDNNRFVGIRSDVNAEQDMSVPSMDVPNERSLPSLSDSQRKIVDTIPEERRYRFFEWRQSLFNEGLSVDEINEQVESALNRYSELQNDAEEKITEVSFSQSTDDLTDPTLAYRNEVLNAQIMIKFVEDHVRNGDDWDLFLEDDNVLMVVEDEEIVVSSFSELIEMWKEDLEYDVQNYNGYLDSDELEYLGIEEIEHPEGEKELEVITEQDVKEQIEQEMPSQAKENVKNKESREKMDAIAGVAQGTYFDNYKQIATLIDKKLPVTDLAGYFGLTVVPNGRNVFKTNEHDSLIMWENSNHFEWYSQQIKGSATKMYMTFKDVNFKVAVKEILEQFGNQYGLDVKGEKINIADSKPKRIPQKETEEVRFRKLTQTMADHNVQNKNMRNALAYLQKTRGIDPEITNLFVKRGMLWQGQDDSKFHNPEVIFTTKNENGMLCGVFHRSCNSNSKYRGTYAGSDESRGWFFEPTADVGFNWYKNNQKAIKEGKEPIPLPFNANKPLLVFEANIEMLSYMSLLKERSKTNPALDYRNFAYLSTNGVAKSDSIDKTCELYGYKNVYVMYNNDFDKDINHGKEAAQKAVERLSEKGIKASVHLPTDHNDWNDVLIASKKQKQLQKGSKEIRKANIER